MNIPTSPEAEAAIIGCCVTGGLEVSLDAIQKVNPKAFFDQLYLEAFTVIERLASEGSEIDEVTFAITWKKEHDGKFPPSKIIETFKHISIGQLDGYIKTANDTATRRSTLMALGSSMTQLQDQNIETGQIIADLESSILQTQTSHGVNSISADQASTQMIDKLEQRFNLNGALSGIATGFCDLDIALCGLQHGELAVIGARPSGGKTSIALNIFRKACLTDRVPTLFVTYEMSVPSLMIRLLSDHQSIPMNTLKTGKMSQADFLRTSKFQLALKQSPAHFIDAIGGLNISKLTSAIRRDVRRFGIKLVIVDYLQKIKSAERHEKRTYEVAEVSNGLKAIAASMNVSVLALAQLNRENVKDKSRLPRISDLADSGQIERDADMISLIHREPLEEDAGRTSILIAKQRDGETGVHRLQFNGQFCRFETPSRISDEDIPKSTPRQKYKSNQADP